MAPAVSALPVLGALRDSVGASATQKASKATPSATWSPADCAQASVLEKGTLSAQGSDQARPMQQTQEPRVATYTAHGSKQARLLHKARALAASGCDALSIAQVPHGADHSLAGSATAQGEKSTGIKRAVSQLAAPVLAIAPLQRTALHATSLPAPLDAQALSPSQQTHHSPLSALPDPVAAAVQPVYAQPGAEPGLNVCAMESAPRAAQAATFKHASTVMPEHACAGAAVAATPHGAVDAATGQQQADTVSSQAASAHELLAAAVQAAERAAACFADNKNCAPERGEQAALLERLHAATERCKQAVCVAKDSSANVGIWAAPPSDSAMPAQPAARILDSVRDQIADTNEGQPLPDVQCTSMVEIAGAGGTPAAPIKALAPAEVASTVAATCAPAPAPEEEQVQHQDVLQEQSGEDQACEAACNPAALTSDVAMRCDDEADVGQHAAAQPAALEQIAAVQPDQAASAQVQRPLHHATEVHESVEQQPAGGPMQQRQAGQRQYVHRYSTEPESADEAELLHSNPAARATAPSPAAEALQQAATARIPGGTALANDSDVMQASATVAAPVDVANATKIASAATHGPAAQAADTPVAASRRQALSAALLEFAERATVTISGCARLLTTLWSRSLHSNN